jgi:hypothetical protein
MALSTAFGGKHLLGAPVSASPAPTIRVEARGNG